MSAACIIETPESVAQWAEEELGGAQLGDKRLDARLVEIVASFMSAPQGSIPRATGDWAGAKAAYRFFDNSKVDPQAINDRHVLNVIDRASTESVVLSLSDTTQINHTRHSHTDGLGPLGDLDHWGLLYQPTLIVTPERVPLGLIDQQTWVRYKEFFGESKTNAAKKRPIEEKESMKWLESLSAAERFQKDLAGRGHSTRVVSVFDREGDVFEVLSKAVQPDTENGLLVRAAKNRRVEHPQKYIWESMESERSAGTVVIKVPRKTGVKEREATLAVRFAKVTIYAPQNRKVPDRTPVEIFCVYAHEEDPPEHTPAVSWMLLTTEEVLSFDDACRMIDWYAARWSIEVFFRILKSGCEAEERQLETLERLQRCLVLDSIVAWRILYLTTIGRETPDVPCTVVFEDHEWQAAWAFVKRDANIPDEPPKLGEFVRLIGRLGGHLGRKHDGDPGPMSMWRGLQRLPDLAGMWLVLREQSG